MVTASAIRKHHQQQNMNMIPSNLGQGKDYFEEMFKDLKLSDSQRVSQYIFRIYNLGKTTGYFRGKFYRKVIPVGRYSSCYLCISFLILDIIVIEKQAILLILRYIIIVYNTSPNSVEYSHVT